MKSHSGAALLYAVLTVAMTWPLAARLDLMEPGDSSYFAWAMAWTSKALLNDPVSLPHANTLHPLRYTLFLDEPIVGTSILSLPFRVVTTDPIVTLNVVRLLTFFLTAVGVRALALSLGLSPLSAFAVGAFFSFSSNRTASPAHISMLGTQFLPWYFFFLHRWAKTGAAKAAALAGLFFGLSAWACGYQALLAAAILPLPILAMVERKSFLKTAPLGLAIALALVMPLRYLHEQALSPLGFERTEAETAFFSASVENLFSASASNRVWGVATQNLRTIVEADLFQGVTVFALAFTALLVARRRIEQRRIVIVYAFIALCAWLVALGPDVRAFGSTLFHGPFELLRSFEAFRMIRVPARASVFVALGLSMLAGFGLDAIRKVPTRAALIALGLAEAWSAPLNVVAAERCVRAYDSAPRVYEWLRDAPGGGAVIELPILQNDGLFQRPRFDDSVYLLRSTIHWRPLANGYAGTEPLSYTKLREAMRSFPSAPAIELLRSMDVRTAVLHLRGFGPNRRAVIEERLPQFADDLSQAARFDDDVVLTIKPRPSR